MLTSTMYFTVKNKSSSSSTTENKCDGFDLGSVCINVSSILISIIINLILFIPTFTILEMFKRSKPRKSRLNKLKQSIGLKISGNKDKNNRKMNKFGPWWLKIIAYIFFLIKLKY